MFDLSFNFLWILIIYGPQHLLIYFFIEDICRIGTWKKELINLQISKCLYSIYFSFPALQLLGAKIPKISSLCSSLNCVRTVILYKFSEPVFAILLSEHISPISFISYFSHPPNLYLMLYITDDRNKLCTERGPGNA